MSILFFGDLQLKANRPIEFEDWDLSVPMTDKISEMCKTVSWISDIIDKEDPEEVVFLGDLTEEQHKLSLYTIYLIKQAFRLLIDDKRNYTFLLGNHDIADPEGNCNNLILVPDQDNITIVRSTIPVVKDGDLYTSCIYKGNKPDVERYMDYIKDVKVDTIISHMPIKGMQFTTGVEDPDGVDLKDLNVKRIIIGHYHNPQVITKEGIEIRSIGAPMYHDFRDEWDSHRGICIKDGEKFTHIENPYTRRYIKVQYPDTKDVLGKAVERFGEENLNVRIICPTELIEGIKIDYKFNQLNIVPVQNTSTQSRATNIGLETSYEDEVSIYVDKERPRRLDKDKLVEIGLGLIKNE